MSDPKGMIQNGRSATSVVRRLIICVFGASLLMSFSYLDSQAQTSKEEETKTPFPKPPGEVPGEILEKWLNDQRINSSAGRSRIVRDAKVRAFRKLDQCGSDSHIIRFWKYKSSSNRRLSAGYKSNSRNTMSIEVDPVRVSREANVAARIAVKYRNKKIRYFPELGGWPAQCGDKPVDKSKWYGAIKRGTGADCYSEEFHAAVEIPPEVFVRKELWIPSESRWARDPIEATMYLIIHELGHLEAAISKDSKLHKVFPFGKPDCLDRYPGCFRPFEEVGNSEDDAWEYASSVMRCDR